MTAKHRASKHSGQSGFERTLESAARKVTAWTGSTSAFALSVSVILVWVLTGPIFHYSTVAFKGATDKCPARVRAATRAARLGGASAPVDTEISASNGARPRSEFRRYLNWVGARSSERCGDRERNICVTICSAISAQVIEKCAHPLGNPRC